MLEIKKTYQQPEMKVVVINPADIICTSPNNPENTQQYSLDDYENPWQ